MINPTSFQFTHDSTTGVATITLARPERMNALTFDVYRELTDTFVAINAEPGIKAVVITGTGKAFCTGGDVKEIIGRLMDKDLSELEAFTRLTCDLILAMRNCRRPVVAALNGVTAGAGAVIAAASDFRIAAEHAKIAFLFVKVGLAGADMGAAWLLPRLVGMGHATHLLFTGEFISAERALAIGLYHQVVPDGAVLDVATNHAALLASGPLEALAITKDALNREASMDLETALAHEAHVQAALMQHGDFNEAYQAFVEKRPARFT